MTDELASLENPQRMEIWRWATRLALLFLLGPCQIPVFPAEAKTTMEIHIGVPPIKMLHVDTEWEVVGESTDESGGGVVTLQTQYGVTCNVDGTVIHATLVSELPVGVRLSVCMVSSIGESTGWIELLEGSQAGLVTGVCGSEFGVTEMTIAIPQGLSLPDIPITIVYAIE